MTTQIDQIIPENYHRAFFFKKLCYLMQFSILEHYKKRNFLTIYQDEMLGTYIENSAMNWTLENGKEIFSNERNFKEFEAGYRAVIAECDVYIRQTKKLTKVSLGDFFNHWAIVQKLYYYFEKTEFFFTDACYVGNMSDTLKKNLLVLGDDLKMVSRPQIVEILTTILYHLVHLTSKQTGIDEEIIKAYSFDEIIALFELNKTVDLTVIAERQESFVLYSTDGNNFVPIEGKDKETILARFKQKDYSNQNEFKGTIANKGKVTARAKVILPELNIPYEAFAKKLYSMPMNPGDILITETTSPDFVPLMKKAGGIIANQGGLNSHAAIMSRELGVPCLVGTYHATDIVRTGDLIELDANTGIVKVLERAGLER